VVTFRPERCVIGEVPDDWNRVKGTVIDTEYAGENYRVRLDCRGEALTAIHQGPSPPAAGETVWCGFPQEACWTIPAPQD
jgi:hypothetical protein